MVIGCAERGIRESVVGVQILSLVHLLIRYPNLYLTGIIKEHSNAMENELEIQ